MGVFYSVAPLDETTIEYLHQVGANIPERVVESRNPTLEEVRAACADIRNLKVEVFTPPTHAWQVVIGDVNDHPNEPFTILNVDEFKGCESEPHSIWFDKGWPVLILQIVHSLSRRCGPLAIVPDTGCTPIVVTSSDDIDSLLQTWSHTRGIPDDGTPSHKAM